MISAFVLIAATSTPLDASIVNFDDINASAGDVPLEALSPYQGFTWANVTAYTSVPGFPGFNNGIVSAPNAAFTSGDALGAPIVSTITRMAGFDFTSVYLGSGWYDGLSVTLNPFGCGPSGCSQVTLDDLNVTLLNSPPPAVPEPGTFPLLCLAVIAFAASPRLRRALRKS